MNKTALAVYALGIAALVVWWASTESMIALGLLIALVVISGVHVIRMTSTERFSTRRSIDEGHTRSSFPRPPEAPRG